MAVIDVAAGANARVDGRVLDATLRCVARWGVAKTTLDDVAREAGCSRATVYRAFPGGKEALLEALARREVSRFFAELDARTRRRLAEQGTPVIPPSPLVPREPVRRDGFSITFWEFVPEDRTKEPDYVANCESTAALHAALDHLGLRVANGHRASNRQRRD